MISKFIDRIIRACKLDVSLYEEVENDKSTIYIFNYCFNSTTLQAAAVVVLSSMAAGIGSFKIFGSVNFFMPAMLSLVSWYIWAYLVYFIGVKLFSEPSTQADHGQLLRTIGFSSAPGLIRVFGFTPELMSIVFIGGGIWMLIAMVIAVRQALDYKEPFQLWLLIRTITFTGKTASTLKSILVVIIGFLVQTVILVMILRIFGSIYQ